MLFIDSELKLRTQKIFVTTTLNGSEFEKLVRPHEIITNFGFEKVREKQYNQNLELLSEVLNLFKV